MECEITADGKRKFNPLYRYEITENRMEDIGNYSYQGTIENFDALSSKKAFVLDNYTDGGKKLILLDEKCEVMNIVSE